MGNKNKDNGFLNLNLEPVLEFIEKNNLSRDRFIEVVKETRKYGSCAETFYIESEPWMNIVKNLRKTYESAIVLRSTENKLNDTYVDAVIARENTTNEDKDKESNIYTMKEVQRLRDKNTALRKIHRDELRNINDSEDILSELKESINDINFNLNINNNIIDINNTKVGIMQLTDWHLNEIINEDNNKFDFKIASKRMRYFTKEAIRHFKNNGITEVYLVNTGDNINSNRRDSEKINSSTGRVRATLIAVKLMLYVISDLAENFNVNVSFVSSNESRIEKDVELDELSASENFDIIIYNILSMFVNDDNINFIDCDMVEGIMNIKELDKNIMITHGYQISPSNIQKKIQEIKGKYASRRVLLDYIIFGDKHSAYISSNFARSGSGCGGNGYSDNALGFDSCPSQNIYIMSKDSVSGTVVNLVNTHNIDGYDISEELNKWQVKGLL